jgi:hypothetical protein
MMVLRADAPATATSQKTAVRHARFHRSHSNTIAVTAITQCPHCEMDQGFPDRNEEMQRAVA